MTLPEFLGIIQTVSTFSKTMPVYYIVKYFKEVRLGLLAMRMIGDGTQTWVSFQITIVISYMFS